jgi:hypothetical protein
MPAVLSPVLPLESELDKEGGECSCSLLLIKGGVLQAQSIRRPHVSLQVTLCVLPTLSSSLLVLSAISGYAITGRLEEASSISCRVTSLQQQVLGPVLHHSQFSGAVNLR